ncbi:MAG: V-type ATP synthase subunit E [Promethearchaeota archaeon]
MDSVTLESRLNLLKTRVLEDARNKAKKILKDAETLANEIKKKGEEQLKFYKDEYLKSLQEEHKNESLEKLNDFARKYAKAILKFKQKKLQELLQEIFMKYKEKLISDPNSYYESFLKKVIDESLQHASFSEYHLILNEKDKAYMKEHPKFLEKFGKKIVIRPESLPEDELGCIIEDKDGLVKFDNRLSKRLEIQFEVLKTKLSKILFKA